MTAESEKEAPTDAGTELVRFASRLRFTDIPPSVIARKKDDVLDLVGSAIAGITAEGIPDLCAQVSRWGGRPEASIIGARGVRVPAPLAALCNATMARALELDGVHEKALCHTPVAAIPVALALAEERGGVNGREFLAAIVAGEEIAARLAFGPHYDVAGPKHKPRGWSFNYQAGTLGGAVAAGKILGLDEEKLHDTFGNAYTALAGNQQAVQEGVLAVRVQQGLCAQTSAQSACFARANISGPRRSLEGKFGWLTFWHGDAYDRLQVVGELGSRWESANVSIKPYPTCKVTHPAIIATIQAVKDAGISHDQVERLTVHVNSQETWEIVVHPVEHRRAPANPIDAQFCLPFLCAVALINGTVTVQDLDEKGIRDPQTLAMAQRVHPVIDEQADISQGRIMPVPVTVDLLMKDGRTITRRCDYPVGHPSNPMTAVQLEAKFRDCAAVSGYFSDGRLAELLDVIRNLEQVPDVAALSRLLQ